MAYIPPKKKWFVSTAPFPAYNVVLPLEPSLQP